jgi:hypothetical protein
MHEEQSIPPMASSCHQRLSTRVSPDDWFAFIIATAIGLLFCLVIAGAVPIHNEVNIGTKAEHPTRQLLSVPITTLMVSEYEAHSLLQRYKCYKEYVNSTHNTMVETVVVHFLRQKKEFYLLVNLLHTHTKTKMKWIDYVGRLPIDRNALFQFESTVLTCSYNAIKGSNLPDSASENYSNIMKLGMPIHEYETRTEPFFQLPGADWQSIFILQECK